MRASTFIAAAVLLGCKDQDTPATIPPRGDCNPVDGSHCLLPFPSNFFLEADTATGSGHRVSFGANSLPINDWEVPLDPTAWNRKDGFPTLGPLFAHFPGVSTDSLAGHRDIGASLEAGAHTVILDAETGERHPHFAELDVSSEEVDSQLLILRPAQPMEHARRYVVAIKGLEDDQRQPLDAPEGFATLREALDTDDPDLERQRDHYDQDVFPVLEQAGLPREDLQLAWDFVTVSAETSLADALWIRQDALARVDEGGPSYTILDVEDAQCEDKTTIGRTITGTLQAPLYLTSWEPGSTLARDDSDQPLHTGEADAPFTIRVPCTLLEDPRAGTLIQYGHGVLGSQDEVRTDYLGEMANAHGWILFAVDWTGMKEDDFIAIATAVANDFSDFVTVPDRLHQGQVEQLMAGRMMLGDMADDDALAEDGVPLVDREALYYYGNSQGAILGGSYVALSPDIERAVLGVGGTPFSLVLPRAVDFDTFFLTMQHTYDNPADIALILGLTQMLWDPGETAGWAHFLTDTPIDDDTPTKDLLIHAAIGDAGVTTLAAHVMARAAGASLVEPATREVWGLETREAPFEGSALVEFDYGVEEPEDAVACDAETDTHENPRRERVAWEQMFTFIEQGTVEHVCDGTCDPD